jgi:radical SAM/Cys-rich protein
MIEPFAEKLSRNGLALRRDHTSTLQVNVGRLCNQACRHCHLEAGPYRREIMSSETMEEVASFAARCGFDCIDITGGAPEMVPGLDGFLRRLTPLAPKLMLRSNLTAIAGDERRHLADVCRELRVSLVASFPSTSSSQTDSQRGSGVWEQSIAMLRELNGMGFGIAGSGLELSLVVNPAGAFMPADQCQLEKKYRQDLARRWGISFSSLFSFANMPLGRFGSWLKKSGNFDRYMEKLIAGFNAETLPGLMCRSLLSVSWDGHLYDCDFNQAAGLPLGGEGRHVRNLESAPPAGTAIAVADHCYACTAGSGFT